MKRIFLVALALATIPTSVSAQMIDDILAAATPRARENATVVKWNADFTYETLKEGSNQMVCYNRADERDRPPFAVQCTNLGNLERVAQSRRFRAATSDAAGEREMVAEAEANGTRVLPEYGSIWLSMNGADRGSARTHVTIAVPMATEESTGFPESRAGGDVYLMSAGTTTAHLMMPGE
jgi:hypothetical protein